MNTQWIKEATNEELLEHLDVSYNNLNKAKVFSDEHRESFFEIKMIKEEILNRMKGTNND